MPPAALDGLRVLDLSNQLSGPYCAMLLGDLGADVVKVEHPAGGDAARAGAPHVGGELMVTLEPRFVFGSPNYAEHGQPSDDDTHVALVFWGAGIRAGTYANRVSVVDIAPTLAALLGVQPTEPIQGRALTEALRR